MTKIGGVPIKTRLPLTAWVLAGLLTLFSVAFVADATLHPVPR